MNRIRTAADLEAVLDAGYAQLPEAEQHRFDQRRRAALLEPFHRGRLLRLKTMQDRARRRNEMIAWLITNKGMAADTLANWRLILTALKNLPGALSRLSLRVEPSEPSPSDDWLRAHRLTARQLRRSFLAWEKTPLEARRPAA